MNANPNFLPCELSVEPKPLSGLENMSRDEALLEQVSLSPTSSIVRIYRWSVPTVSLGYFQPGDADVDSRMTQCPRVKRITGGGAILHDTEITYSCAIPATHPIKSTPTRLYEVVHAAVVNLLSDCGVTASMRMHAEAVVDGKSEEPFLCFLRSDPRDVVIKGKKILGSAQRRRRGSILQHGSILLEASALTPEIPGIIDLCPKFDASKFYDEIGHAIREAVSGCNRL